MTTAWLAIAAGVVLRLTLASTSIPAFLSTRNELSSPVTAFARLKEGAFVARSLRQDPYAGGSFHQSPLLLTLPFDSDGLLWLVYVAVDACSALLLARSASYRRRADASTASDAKVASMYLLHPFVVASFASRSSVAFVNLAIALSLYCASHGNVVGAAAALSTAAHLGVYPVLLLPAVCLLSQSRQADDKGGARNALLVGTGTFALHHTAILTACRQILGNWNFLRSFYGVVLSIPDLTPTIGLGWYFFIEMFDHFRLFFVGVFQLHTLIYVVPFTYYCRNDPLFAVMLQWGVIALFGSYPELGHFGLLHTLMVILSSYHRYLSRLTLFVPVTLYALALLPSFHYLWLYEGSGNANFFYASTLVWTIGQGGLLVDWLSAYGKHEMHLRMGKEAWSKIDEGKWKLVQR